MDVVEQRPKTLRRETYRRRRDTRRASKPDVTARNLAAAWIPHDVVSRADALGLSDDLLLTCKELTREACRASKAAWAIGRAMHGLSWAAAGPTA